MWIINSVDPGSTQFSEQCIKKKKKKKKKKKTMYKILENVICTVQFKIG